MLTELKKGSIMVKNQEEICIKVENALKKLNARNLEDDKTKPIENISTYINDDGKEYNTKDRIIKTVQQPVSKIPTDEELFKTKDIPDYKFLLQHFKREGKLTEEQTLKIVKLATNIMMVEPNLLKIDVPASVVGDIHGQFYDLLGMFELCGDPKDTQYLFLGDYVDRGDRSIEVLLLLYAMKINFPNKFWLLRGNHETKRMTSYFTYKKECIQRYSEKLYNASLDSFKALPLCAVLNDQFFCIHAGISSKLWDLEDINKINRFKEDFPSKGLLCDLMWSDPSEKFDEEQIKEEDIDSYYTFNSERHCSEFYSYKAIETFLNHNDLLSVVRGHQPQDSGYRIYKVNEVTNFPSLITIFSAPNYCGTYDNMAAVLVYDGESFNIKQYDSSPAPYFLPDQMNLFEWSLPFVCEKVVEILSAVLNICTEDELNEDEILLNKKDIAIIENSDKNIIKINEESLKIKANPKDIKSNEITEKIKDQIKISTKEVIGEMEDNDTDTDNNDIFEDALEADANGNPIKTIIKGTLLTGDTMRKKILMVGRMSRLLTMLREEAEKVDEIKILNNGFLPKQILLDGREELHKRLKDFKEARAVDIENEGLPPTKEEQAAIAQKKKRQFADLLNQLT
jgi:serine/threonine-protein phosphatase 2B catalytic subunit